MAISEPWVLQFFRYDHLPMPLQEVAHPFSVLAHELAAVLPTNPESSVSLRKLLEAKDAAVRAVVADKMNSGDPNFPH